MCGKRETDVLLTASSSTLYTGYSLGDHIYRQCSHGHQQGHPDPEIKLAFSVHKTKCSMQIRYFSKSLWAEVSWVLVGSLDRVRKATDGFELLRNHAALERHLKHLRANGGPGVQDTVNDLDLLVSGLLSDDEPFRSYGYEELREEGCMTAERYTMIQHQSIERDIDAIDEGFLAAENAEYAWSGDFPSIFNSEDFFLQAPDQKRPDSEQAEQPTDHKSDIVDDACGIAEALPVKTPRGQLEHLNHEFTKEYARIQNCFYAQLTRSHKPPELYMHQTGQLHWGVSLDGTKVKAWKSGIAVLKGLTKGQVPTTMNEILMFLAIAKSIATVKFFHDDGATNYYSQFDQDLVRWQAVFASNLNYLSMFRMLVYDLWQVDLENSPNERGSLIHPGALLSLQDIALRLVDEGTPLLLDDRNGRSRTSKFGLLFSQKQWRQTVLTEKFEGDGTNGQSPKLNTLETGDRVPEAALPRSRPPDDCSEGYTRHVSPPINPIHAHVNPLISLLMAGAIFAMIIAFLLGMFCPDCPWL